MSSTDITRLHDTLVRNWDITPCGGGGDWAEEELVRRLSERVRELMRHDHSKLLSSMYLLDVPESRFNQALKQPGFDDKADAIARLILDRELEKMRMREYYARRTRTTDSPELDLD